MEFIIKIQCDNAAFTNDPELEIARILRTAARHLETDGLKALDNAALMDANGNKVGICLVIT